MSYYDESILADLYKDAYGCRPREMFWANWNASTETEKEATWAYLIDDLDREDRAKQLRQTEAVAEWRADIARNLAIGASTRRAAILWDTQAYGLDRHDRQNAGYYCFLRDLPPRFEKEIERVLRAR